jgi:hypothetical protein
LGPDEAEEASTGAEDLVSRIQDLKPGNDGQSAFQAQALQIGSELQQIGR